MRRSPKRLKIWTHDFRNTAALGGCLDFIYRSFLEAATFFESLDRHIYADFVPKLETVGDRFRWCKYPQASATDAIFLGAELQSQPRHSHESGGRGDYAWCPRFHVYSDPYLRRRFSREVVKVESGEKANYAPGNFVGDSYERPVFGDW
jgi:hypothetical protein